MKIRPPLWLAIGMILVICMARSAQPAAEPAHVPFPGDFNGDGKTDLLYLPTRTGMAASIALADGAGLPQADSQVLPPMQFGVHWSLDRIQPVIGDFNGDSLDDVLLQSTLHDASYVILANANPGAGPIGSLLGIRQEIAPQAFGIEWSRATHRILSGDFDGDRNDDLLLQATRSSGVHAVLLADKAGDLFTASGDTCWLAGPHLCWADGDLNFAWNELATTLEIGDFNGDGRADVLLQAWPRLAGSTDAAVGDVRGFPNQGFGTAFSTGLDSAGLLRFAANQRWNVDGLGTDWSPLERTLLVGDFSGDGRDDVFLQANRSGQPNQLALADRTGTLQNAIALTNEAADWTTDRVRLIEGRFGNGDKAGLLLQWHGESLRYGIATGIVGGNFLVIPVDRLATRAATSTGSATGNSARSRGARGRGDAPPDPGGGFEALAAVTPPSATTAVGATPATADVTQNGSAVYSIPIKLPRGTAGLTPELALAYNSGSGNGLVGVGWNLTGLGVIARCPKTIAQDGLVQPVQLTTLDEYCLNGNRLRLIPGSGSQGQANSEYRTEIETYARVKVLASIATGPSKWQVERKDGLIEEYGGTTDSSIAIQGNGSVYRLWALSKVRDRSQNQYAVTYENDVATKGSYRPQFIHYTSNPAQGSSAPYTVQFSYGPRNTGENLVSYYGGGIINQDKRLTKVEYLYGGVSRRRYDLTYQSSSGAFNYVSRLGTIQECSQTACMAPTVFSWSDVPMAQGGPALGSAIADHGLIFDSYVSDDPYSPPYSYTTQGRSLDINGDGITDAIETSRLDNNGYISGGLVLYIGTATGQVLTSYTGSYDAQLDGPGHSIVDRDDDGKDDFILGAKWLHQKLDGSYALETGPPLVTHLQKRTDVNGDGFPDALSILTSTVGVRFHNGNGASGWETPITPAWTAPSGQSIVSQFSIDHLNVIKLDGAQKITQADFNGDGFGDLLLHTNVGWRVLYSNGTTFTTGELFATPSYVLGSVTLYTAPILVDYNGDGCTDAAYTKPSVSNWFLATSKCGAPGSSLIMDVATGIPVSGGAWFAGWDSTGTYYDGNVSAIDINADGNQDILVGNQFLLSNGSGFTAYNSWTGGSGGPIAHFWADRNGDGVSDYAHGGPDTNYSTYRPGLGKRPHYLLGAVDGFGKSVAFDYEPMSSAAVYTRGNGLFGRTQDTQSSAYVVKTMTLSDGIGGTYSLGYKYSGAKRNLSGRGYLGVAVREVTDSRTGFVSVDTYSNSVANIGFTGWDLVGTLANRTVYQYKSGPSFGPKVEELSQTWVGYAPDGASNRSYPYVSYAAATRFELSGALISTAVTNTLIDNYGTQYDVRTRTTENGTGINGGAYHDHAVVTPVGYVLNDVANWCLSRPQRIEDTRSHTLTHGTQETRISTKAWDASKCRVTSTTEAPSSGQQLTTALDYDGFGNLWKSTVSGDGIPSNRQPFTEFNFGLDGHLLQWQAVRINTTLRTTQFGWDVALGVRTSVQDPNGHPTIWQYDDFGRERLMTRPDLTRLETLYYICDGSNAYCGDSLLRYVVRKSEQQVNGVEINHVDQFFDVLGRVKYEQSIGFGKVPNAPELIETLRTFDSRDNVVQQSVPYYMSETPIFTTTNFDLLSRPWQVQRPTSDTNGALLTDTVTYSGLTVTRTDALNKSQTTVSSAWGTTVRATDAAGKHTLYTHNAFGDLRSSTDPALNLTEIGYNIRGFKTSMADPDMGNWIYSYDGLGRLLSQVDAKGQGTGFTYDELNRTETRDDHPGGAAYRTTWEWDTSPNGIGQLHWVTSPGGFSEYHWYNGHGKRVQTTTYPGTGNGSYTMVYSHDAQTGRPLQVTYPASTGAQPLVVQYAYQNGFEKSVTDVHGGTVFWNAQGQDARGHVSRESFGNGQVTVLGFDRTNGRLYTLQTGPSGGTATQNLAYGWDGVGNLSTRQDLNQGLIETFGYDALYRLSSTQRNSDTPVTMSYNDIGNLTYKSDVGGYAYPGSGSGSVRPHAVSSAGGLSYSYDANGNMASRNGASIIWASFNYPTTINQSGGNTSSFFYGPERQLYGQVSVDGATTEVRLSIGGGAFERLIRGSQIEYRHFVQVAGKAVAVVKRSDQTGNANYYLHDDHLGSTDVITDQASNVIARLSFDAWGRRRGSNWTGSPSGADKVAIGATTHLGFTGHEQLDNLELVHMKGRVYDPVLARFLSADPIIQDPFHSQAFNRYSYIWNNPLNATDPTGFVKCTGSNIEYDGCQDYDGQLTAIDTDRLTRKGLRAEPDDSVRAGYRIVEIDSASASAQQSKDKVDRANGTGWNAPSRGGQGPCAGMSMDCLTSRKFDSSRSNHQTTAADHALEQAALNAQNFLPTEEGDTEETMAFIVRGYSGALVGILSNARPDQDSDSDFARSEVPRGLETLAVVHWHIPGRSEGMIDSLSKGKVGDVQPLTLARPIVNFMILDRRVGVHELHDGRVVFRMIVGSLSEAEKRAIRSNLDQQQRLFYAK